MTTPVAALAPRSEMLDRLTLIYALHGTVNPTETKSHLHRIHITDNTWIRLPCPIDAKPEILYLVVILKVPGIEFFSGVNIKQIGDFHCFLSFEE